MESRVSLRSIGPGLLAAASWLAWSVATAVPLLSCLPWMLMGWRLRRPRLYVTAALYLFWPSVGLIAATVLSAVFFNDVSGIHGWVEGLAPQDPHSLLILWVAVAMWIVSLLNAQLEWRSLRRDRRRRSDSLARIDDDAIPASRPYWICLLFWATLGWTGAHRFYTGRWLTGAMYLFTLGLLGAGWAADLFLLRRLLLAAPQLNGVTLNVPVAPWAVNGEYRHGWFEFATRVAFFLFAPFLFVRFCVTYEHMELLAVIILVVVVCGLLGNIERVIGRLDLLEKVPLTRPAVGFLRDLHRFYFETRPRPFFHYVFWMIAAPLSAWTSPSVRQEMRLYGRFLLTLYIVIVVKEAQSFGTRYQYIGAYDVTLWLGFHLAFATLVTATFIVPIVTTAMTLNLGGEQSRLKALSVIVLAITLPITALSFYAVNRLKTPTWMSWQMLESRINSPAFRSDLQTESEIFLRHYMGRIPHASDPHWSATHTELTSRYQTHMQAILEANEAKSLEVRVVNEPDMPRPALAVVEQWGSGSHNEAKTLFVMTSDGEFFSLWERLTPYARALFDAIQATPTLSTEFKIAQHSVEFDTRLYDTIMDFLWSEASDLALSDDPQRPTFQPAATESLRVALHAEGVEDAGEFRVFGWDDGWQQWLCVRDSRHVWLLANSDGEFIPQWDKPSLKRPSRKETYLRELEYFDPVASLDLRHEADKSLARDLVREHTRVFLVDAARRRHQADTVEALTRAYRDFVADIVPAHQRPQLHVVELEQSDGWLGVMYDELPLFAAAPDGGFFARGSRAPEVAHRFLAAPATKLR